MQLLPVGLRTSFGAWYFSVRLRFLLLVGVLEATRCLYSAPPSTAFSSCEGSCPAQKTGMRSFTPKGRGRTTLTVLMPPPAGSYMQCST
jgi:hypothetical protein